MRDDEGTLVCKGLPQGMTLIAVLLICAPVASAQTTTQLWGNLTFNWMKSEHLVYELDFEPKVLLAAPEGEPDWRNLDVTPNGEYSLRPWLDLVADTTIGWTKQTDDVNSTELTPRFGARFHLFSRARQLRVVEQAPRRRLVVRDLVRVEARNFFYSDSDTDSDSTVRFRNRLEFLVPLNKERITDDGVRYFLADWEWFVRSTTRMSASPTASASAPALATAATSPGVTSCSTSGRAPVIRSTKSSRPTRT
jgi:hypothetical protein